MPSNASPSSRLRSGSAAVAPGSSPGDAESGNQVDTIALELAVLARRLTAMTTYRKTRGTLDRSLFLLLYQIWTRGQAGTKTLAREFGLNVSTVSRQSAALQRMGLISRVLDPSDRRAFLWEITETGLSELERCRMERVARVGELLLEWSEEDKRRFGELLGRFNRGF